MPPLPLTIVGASARAAAQSAIRAGMAPRSCDLFADRDLLAAGPAERIASDAYPHGFAEALDRSPRDAPWIYTGALENHPDLVDRLAALRPLWGIAGEGLRSVRDPIAVAGCLARRGLPRPDVRTEPDGLPRDGSWLIKPRASAGGRRIRPFLGPVEPSRPSYFQERIDGEPLAAIFAGRDGTARLLGITRQLLGRPGEPFAYVGSLGPWPVSDAARRGIAAVGRALAEEFSLRGIFGVDLVRDPRDRAFPVEVNPRYTASVEVLELAEGRSLLAAHVEAFAPRGLAPGATTGRPRGCVGKAILFAEGPCRLPAIDAWGPRASGSFAFLAPRVADVPAPGSPFDAGEPVLTVLARGGTPASCGARLERRLARWRGRLIPRAGP